MQNYRFATDSENGTIEARDWQDARDQLSAMLTDDMIADGAHGWVENVDGERFSIGPDDREYVVEVRAIDGWTIHSRHSCESDAQDQADMVRGRVRAIVAE